MKKRIDLLLVEKKLAESRSKAQAMIMAGQVSISGKKILKSGEIYDSSEKIDLSKLGSEWVSRGAYKLIHAIEKFKIDIKNKICLDLGSSTGGFTQVLLEKKAKKIYSIDVGTNQLHEKLKEEKKIIFFEKTNARYLDSSIIKESVDIIVCDVSFISMKKVIEPNICFLKKNNGLIIGLIKPQFEATKSEIKKGGVVFDESVHKRICIDFKDWFKTNLNMNFIGLIESPIKGPKGNSEFLIAVKNF